MRAVLTAPETLRWDDGDPAPPPPGHVAIEVHATGICGTDLAIWSGAYPVPLPVVLGHEWVGEVVAAADHDGEEWLGKRVVGEINNHCAALARQDPCSVCASGWENHCLERTVTGIVAADGAFAERVIVPRAVLHEVPPEIPTMDAVLVEPLAAAVQTFERAPISPGDLVVVLGAGRLGSLIAYVATMLGAEVLAVTRTNKRTALLDSLDVEHQLHDLTHRVTPRDPLAPAQSALLHDVLTRSRGRGADLVVEATGTTRGFATALDLVRPRGTIALKTTSGEPLDGINTTRLVVNEVTVSSSRCGPFPRALELLQERTLAGLGAIDVELPLRELETALGAAATCLKAVVWPHDKGRARRSSSE